MRHNGLKFQGILREFSFTLWWTFVLQIFELAKIKIIFISNKVLGTFEPNFIIV